MCFFGGGARAATPPKTTFDDSPPVVTGMQTGVDNPVDTAKVTEELKIKRMNKEGISNPGDSLNIAGVTSCLLYTSPSPRDVEESRMPSSA